MASWERKRLMEGLQALRHGERQRLLTRAQAADCRDPIADPARLDKLMASAGGASARYRSVLRRDGDVVVFSESTRPFDDNGTVKRMPLKKWAKWASKATIQFRGSSEFEVPGLTGYWLHWEIMDACAALGIS